ncbi:MAG: hypothetical protein KAG95_05485 [Bacteroidales bacterium]|nr:hypothetical protein [Bacteroidales bacterium]
MRKTIQILLAILILVISYFTYQSVMEPIRFKQEKKYRYSKVIQRLKDIRKAELAYKEVNRVFTGSFDTLINFVKYDSMPIVRAVGRIPDELVDSITEEEAVKRGIIIRDTIRVSVLDSIFPDNYKIDSIRFVPCAEPNVEFKLGSGIVVTGSKVKVKVFKASALNFEILQGLDKQSIINLNDLAKFPGLKVGSLEEANNNAGNWE